ncbi:MAG: hypothetical protein DSZ28_08660 [Thiothrix sp.]|nr:MAG: hypothetical protein DSZ28_08660 [Thiothrix sp.]
MGAARSKVSESWLLSRDDPILIPKSPSHIRDDEPKSGGKCKPSGITKKGGMPKLSALRELGGVISVGIAPSMYFIT